MKKIYFSFVAVLIGTVAFGQSLSTRQGGHVPLNHVNRYAPPSSTQSQQNFYTDYDMMDSAYQTGVNGYSYTYFIWDMNMNYSYTAGDTSLKWAAVDFAQLYDSYNGATSIPSSSYNSITIDSVYMVLGHSNYSGLNDTLITQILQCTSGGYPSATATVLTADTEVFNTSLTGSNTWLQTGVLTIPFGYNIANNSTKFGVRVRYYGSPLDTFGLVAGFGDLGQSCGSIPALTNMAVRSNYYPDSYRHDMRWALPPYNIQQLPTSTNQDIYYDCDGSGTYATGTDGENFMQNWQIWINATIDGVGMDEFNTISEVGQNIPNPTNNTTAIPFRLKAASNVSLSICDVAGKVVYSEERSNVATGQNEFVVNATNLAAGVYYYTVTAGTDRITQKMIVTQ
ncbi:MAG TPA: T9SS type A sorting domain-containing protein [Bacteroidia bacterium]|jgi:hypothetical protein|nr:T9SS type A sorting domain-containing protein [Bacteroidia bacterium]